MLRHRPSARHRKRTSIPNLKMEFSESMRKETIQNLIPDSRNANKGTQRGASLIQKSLQELGAGRSILVDKDNHVIAGNKTLEAAAAIGLENVRVVETDGTELVVVKRMDVKLDSKRGRELAIADNRTSQVGLEWDAGILAEFIEEDILSKTGFHQTSFRISLITMRLGM